ncbi:MAG: hypothetical protein ACRDHZ_20260, partial [Ktedonobacteraceae bacterium]
MNEIRAFVGHSFTDDDHDVVDKLLTYLRQLSKMLPQFTWDHAESAEPKDLAAKVLSLLADKNVFIGICTKKERVIKPDALKPAAILRGFMSAREVDFEWKTSDWIIQEIGLAKGKNLDLILLVENGVRDPGGLQGNIEYIPFERNALDKAFGKIVEMITALTPKVAGSLTVSSETSATQETKPEEPKPAIGDDWLTPKPDWRRSDYDFVLSYMIAIEDIAGTVAIDQEYLKTEDAILHDNKESWAAQHEFLRIDLSKGGSLERLKALADLHPHSSGTQWYLAQAFEHYEDYARAATAYEASAREATDAADRAASLGRAAAAYTRAGVFDAASVSINAMKLEVESGGSGEIGLLRQLNELANIRKDDGTSIAIMERIVELDRSDTDTRFSLAYKHSEIGNNDLALFHYLKIPYADRKASTWNNLGVAFTHFSLPAKAIEAFRKAEGMGGTLAMSNLAGKFITAGFLPEAAKQCETVIAIKDYHKNVGHFLARLKDVPEEED